MAKSHDDAGNYAGAVFRIALERDSFDQWKADLELVSGLAQDAVLLTFFENSGIGFEQKQAAVARLKDAVDPLAMNLLYVLIREKKLKLLPLIAETFARLSDEHHGIEPASVTTAVPLDDAEKEYMAEKLGLLTGKRLRLTTNVDPEILGGYVARIGDKLIDGSTRHRLETLKKRIGGAA